MPLPKWRSEGPGHPPSAGDESASGPAFIIACPRSGTTWLRQALNAHPEVHCTEKRLFGMYCDLVFDAGVARPRVRITMDRYVDAIVPVLHGPDLRLSPDELRGRLLKEMSRVVDRALCESSGKRVLVDKVTPYAGTAAEVAEGVRRNFPGARIIHLIRDGRDVATSGVFHWLNKRADVERPNAVRDRRREFFLHAGQGGHLDAFFSEEDLGEWCSQWTTALEAVDMLQGAHPTLTLRYEEMIRDMAGSLGQVCAFLGVQDSAAVVKACAEAASFEKMSGGRAQGQDVPTAHVRKGVVGDWRNYFTKRDAEVFVRLAGAQLVRLGYEADASWAGSLPVALKLSR